MNNLLKIPSNCIVDKELPKNKIYKETDSFIDDINKITIIATLKPGLIPVEIYIDDKVRCEEIIILSVELNEIQNIYKVLKPIYKKIKYYCLIIVEYYDKYKFSVCNFSGGKIDFEQNILNNIILSSWIHTNCLSMKAKDTIDLINNSINTEKDLLKMYQSIHKAVYSFEPHNISRSKAKLLIEDMIGEITDKQRDEILKYCSPYEWHPTLTIKKNKQTRKAQNFIWLHDCEDIWYCFMQNERIKNIIINRRYRDIDELIFRVESRYWEDET